IEHIELKYPVLRIVSTSKITDLETELQQLVLEKQKLSLQIILVKAKEGTYEQVEYNRLNNRVTYRDLLHQATKRKKIWPLRKVLSEFTEEVFKLVPCWLASPESASAVFPMTEIFDLVIFDEASQCFAERGIPVMYRAKNILVAGDSNQLRPGDFYQVRWEGDDDLPETEVDSLLELTERYVSSVHLQGHYRSKCFELIEFSNKYFYKNRLVLLPDRHYLNEKPLAIKYEKVNGVWENQTNVEEAQKVVSVINEILREDKQRSIGVVTFNAPQQELILDVLEEEFLQTGLTIPETLFIKNIENVQGDERDIIIFSTAYAPDKKGKLTLQFGSLSSAGGQNRLNVAITRAREKIIIVSSLYPEQLMVDDTRNEGPKLLKLYLQFAKEVSDRVYQQTLKNGVNVNYSLQLKRLLQNEMLQQESVWKINTLPFADMHVERLDQYQGVVLTDDDCYYQSLSVKDSHAYTPITLSSKNWPSKIVYSRQYWNDPDKVITELRRL
ncbi:MAG: AAA domain-containing protein, partial [Flammeovirgaceae bacterium]|nr:AAA domain-containing protein [Flammeovirgaceae bacterium]